MRGRKLAALGLLLSGLAGQRRFIDKDSNLVAFSNQPGGAAGGHA